MYARGMLLFGLFLLAIVFSVLQFTDFDYTLWYLQAVLDVGERQLSNLSSISNTSYILMRW
jgi:hypothetical protein